MASLQTFQSNKIKKKTPPNVMSIECCFMVFDLKIVMRTLLVVFLSVLSSVYSVADHFVPCSVLLLNTRSWLFGWLFWG